MTTAPNSLMPRANIMMKPDTTDRHACGRETVKKMREGEAPSISAAFSVRSGTAAKPSRAALMRNGRLTKAIAIAMPAPLLTNMIPAFCAAPPRRPSRERKPSRAMPAAV